MADNVLTLKRTTPPRSTRDILARLAEEAGITSHLAGLVVETAKGPGTHILRDPGARMTQCYTYPNYGQQFILGKHTFAEYSKSGGCASCLHRVASASSGTRAEALQVLSRLAEAHAAAALPSKFTVGALSSRRSRARGVIRELTRQRDLPERTLDEEVFEAAVQATRVLEAELTERLASPEVDLAIRHAVCTEMLGTASADALAGLDDTPTIVGMGKNIWQSGRLTDLIRDRYTLDAEASVILEVPRFIADYLLATTDFRWIRRSGGKYTVPQTAPAGYSPEELQLAGLMFDPDTHSSMRSLRHALESARTALAT